MTARVAAPARPVTPAGPARLAPWRHARRAWRRLRRMDTALLLLLGVAVAAFVGTIVPQAPTAPDTVEAWRDGVAGPGAGIARAFDAAGLFDVLGAWWLQALVGLLLVSLVGCITPRARAFVTQVRRPVPGGRNLDQLRHHVVFDSPLAPPDALAAVERVLRRRRMRVRRVPADQASSGVAQVAAERGAAREAASLVFHVSIVLLLAGAAVSSLGGFRGQVDLVEGDRFAETAVVYSRALRGPWWGTGDHRGFLVGLERFTLRTHPDGTPSDFAAELDVAGAARTVRVGRPVRAQGMTLHLARHGVAPSLVVRSGERVLADQPVLLRRAGDLAWAGALELRLVTRGEAAREVTLDVVLLPDGGRAGAGRVVRATDGLPAPVVLVEARAGDRSLGPAVSVPLGGGAALPVERLTVDFPEVRRWAGLQVSHVPGRPVLLFAAALMLVGLTVSLYAYRWRVWAEAVPREGGSGVLLAGVARSRPEAFAEQWGRLTAEVRPVLQEGSATARESLRR